MMVVDGSDHDDNDAAATGSRGGGCGAAGSWAEAPIKIARMILTIKLDGNWS